MGSNVICWQDGALVFAMNEKELLDVLRKIFNLCEEYGLKLHAEKCKLFLAEAKFCGRVIEENGIRTTQEQRCDSEYGETLNGQRPSAVPLWDKLDEKWPSELL